MKSSDKIRHTLTVILCLATIVGVKMGMPIPVKICMGFIAVVLLVMILYKLMSREYKRRRTYRLHGEKGKMEVRQGLMQK